MDDLKLRIRDLEKEIEIKDQELDRAHKELFRVNSVLERMIADFTQETRLAGLIQKALSPTEIPNISGVEFSTKFVPGSRLGGDYFDIFELEDKLKFGVLVASSSGYAMSALFLSVLIKLSGQIEARRGMDPEQVIHMITKELQPNIPANDSASLFYAVVDRRSFEMKYSSIGSIFAVLQTAGGEVTRLISGGSALSKQSVLPPVGHKVNLGPRDRLIVCSEGVSEGLSGWDLIDKAISKSPKHGVHELRNEILFQAERAIGSAEPQRDQTVIVTEIKDKVIKLAKK